MFIALILPTVPDFISLSILSERFPLISLLAYLLPPALPLPYPNKDNVAICVLLIDLGADIAVRDCRGETCLDMYGKELESGIDRKDIEDHLPNEAVDLPEPLSPSAKLERCRVLLKAHEAYKHRQSIEALLQLQGVGGGDGHGI